jgi:endo-1,4-beta-xylanase
LVHRDAAIVLAVKACISFTVWGFADQKSWIPGTFRGEGGADLNDVNLNAKPQYTALQQTLSLAPGAPGRGLLRSRP